MLKAAPADTRSSGQPVTTTENSGPVWPATDADGASTTWVLTGSTLGNGTLTLTGGLALPQDLGQASIGAAATTLQLTTPATVNVSGRVGYLAAGTFVQPSNGSGLTFQSTNSAVPTTTVRANSSGAFTATVIAGATYKLTGYSYYGPAGTYDSFTVAATHAFNGGENLDVLMALSKVTVVVSDQNGHPVVGAVLKAAPADTHSSDQPVTVTSDGPVWPATDADGSSTAWVLTGSTLGNGTLTLTGGLAVPVSLPEVDSDTLIAISYDFSKGTTASRPTAIVTLTVTAGSAAGSAITLKARAGTILAGSQPTGTVQFSYSLNGGATQLLGAPVALDSTGTASDSLPSGLPFSGSGPFRYTITAAYTPAGGSRFVAGSSAPVTVTQTAPVVLTSIAVTPASPSLVQGASQQLTATGTYSDGSTQNLTASATWAAGDMTVATVSSTGLARGVAMGSTNVSASYLGKTGSSSVAVTHLAQTFTVTAAAQTITYGQPDPSSFTFAISNPSDDVLTTQPTCGVTGAHGRAGTYPIVCSGGVAPYNDTISYTAGILTVGKAAVVVTPTSQSTAYGQGDPVFSYAVTGLVNGDALTAVPTCGVTGAHTHAGTYQASCTGAVSSADYTVDQSAIATLTVAKAALTITAPTLSTTYGTAASTVTFTPVVAGYVAGDTASSAGVGTVGCTTTATITPGGSYAAGRYSIICTATGSPQDYTIGTTAGSLTVAKAVLTVTANSLATTYGAAIPVLTSTVTGLVNGDQTSAFTGAPALATTATVGSHAGSYPITVTPGSLAAANYVFSTVSGTLTVAKAVTSLLASPVRVTTGSQGMVGALTARLTYGSGTAAPGQSVAFVIAGETYYATTDATGTATYLASPVVAALAVLGYQVSFTGTRDLLSSSASASGLTVG